MDGEKAIQMYSSAQVKLKRLAELNKDRRQTTLAKMEEHKTRLLGYFEKEQKTCIPIFVKDQQQPIYLRLHEQVKYFPITEDGLKEVLQGAITVQSLQDAYERLKEDAETESKESKSKKAKKGSSAKKSLTLAEVLTEAVTEALYEKLTDVSHDVKVSKTKERGFKAEKTLDLPAEVLASGVELHRAHQTLAELKTKTSLKKRKYEELKNTALPVISQHLGPNEKQEVEVQGLDGKVKTYEMTAVASKKAGVTGAGGSGGAAGTKRATSATPKLPGPKITVKAFEDTIDDVLHEQPEWKRAAFSSQTATEPLVQEMRNKVIALLVEEFLVLRGERERELEAKRAKKAAATPAASVNGHTSSDVVIKMKLKGRTVSKSDAEDEEPEEEPEEDAQEDPEDAAR